jgi:hypothetical protein
VDSKTGLPLVALDLEGATSPTFENPDYNYGYMQQWNLDIQRTLWGGWFTDIAYAANKGTHLPAYNQQVAQLGDNYLAQAAAQVASNAPTTCSATVTAPAGAACIAQSVANPFAGTSAAGSALSSSTTTYGQLLRPYPQFNGLQYAGAGSFGSTYHSLQATLQKRFAGGGTLLAAYTWAKLLSNTDTITSWLEPGGKGGVQDWNNLRSEKSISSQNVPQHLIVSYVLDLPFGRNKKYLSDLSGIGDKVIGGWGIDGVTTLQSGFPINIAASGNGVNYYGGGLRPNVVAGCKKATSGSGAARVLSGLAGNTGWINPACFTTPAPDFRTRRQDGLRVPCRNLQHLQPCAVHSSVQHHRDCQLRRDLRPGTDEQSTPGAVCRQVRLLNCGSTVRVRQNAALSHPARNQRSKSLSVPLAPSLDKLTIY